MYEYDIHKRFSEKNARWYECYLEDSLYKSDSVGVGANTGSGAKGGRKLKSFYDELCRHIFDINLNLLEQIGDFPITYNERSNSAAIAMALSCLTPYVISEYGVDCKGVDLREDESQNEKQRRTIDFWCATEGANGFDIWIESKHLWLNVGKRAKWEFSSSCIGRIKEAITQVRDIGQLQQAGKLADYDSFKLALFSINVYCAKEQAPDMSELDSIPYEVAEMIQNVAKQMGASPQGVLCSALDLRPSIDTPKENTYHLYEKEYLPFVLLCGVVL
ncbi:hypothetical protein [Helicobacter zhangjianzhongii]|uniref:Uncharacterized protein n=1 Tax=Helicobacter zhangjianzhongii TaxID=2974574 RepID=A0ACC6FQA1_9HELI|nr:MULTISPECIES: hypothetical protein [unclassified Helicobacter]MDL0079313.1 hypothetical protein [Helicobacter sp. CPD2-1]MDL0081344.1 hypothetical protein [Helicobacter sp. XJK30-2]